MYKRANKKITIIFIKRTFHEFSVGNSQINGFQIYGDIRGSQMSVTLKRWEKQATQLENAFLSSYEIPEKTLSIQRQVKRKSWLPAQLPERVICREAKKKKPRTRVIHYNEICTHTLTSRFVRAFEVISQCMRSWS